MNFLTTLGIEYPIIQAPMAGITTPEFVVASAEAGILGSIGAGYLSVEETRDFIRKVRILTDKLFAVNLFVPEERNSTRDQIHLAYEALHPIGQRLGIPFWKVELSESQFYKQIQVLIEEKVKICSFTFGLPDEATVHLLKENGVVLIGTATTVKEAILVEQAGMDAVVVQGSEAGGHRGSFFGELEFFPLSELLTQVVEVVRIPIIAAGGIANKNQTDQALATGAEAVQIGTALLATEESGANTFYKEAILKAEIGSTVLTTAFTGKTARGIQNRFITEMKDAVIAPYPEQHYLTKMIRAEAAKQGKSEYMSLWAGENVHLTEAGSVKDIVKRFS